MDETLPSAFVNVPSVPAPDAPNHLPLETYLSATLADADRMAAAWDVGPATAPVTSCPGWSLLDLLTHTGAVHRWATAAITTASAPEGGLTATPPDADVGSWLRDGAADLVDALAATDPDDDTWHPFPGPKKNWFWHRRMSVETMIHRVDAELAVGSTSTLRTDLAIVALHEVFDVGYRRSIAREKLAVPASSVHVHCTDDERPDGWGEWLLQPGDGDYVLTTEHAKGDAAIRGRADDILLAILDRGEVERLDIVGDDSAATEWLELPGW